MSVSSFLHRTQEKLSSSCNAIEELKTANDELKQEMEICREREAELLNFTEKLTHKNVNLQSEFAILEAKVNIYRNLRTNLNLRPS